MSCSEIFLSQDGIFQHSTDCARFFFLLSTVVTIFGKHRLISQFLENVSSLDFLPNALFSHQSTTDCTAQTLLTETLNTTKFIEVTSHTETFSTEKESEKTTLFLLLA